MHMHDAVQKPICYLRENTRDIHSKTKYKAKISTNATTI